MSDNEARAPVSYRRAAFKADGTWTEPLEPNAEAAPAVTFINGRGFRDESREPSPKYGVSTDEMAQVRARTAEAAEFRQAVSDHTLAQALKLGAALKALKEG